VLVEHRVDDVDERLIAVDKTVAAGQQVALEPTFDGVFAEHLHDAAFGSEIAAVGVLREVRCEPHLLGDVLERLQSVRLRLVRAEDAEVPMFSRVTSRRKLPRVGTLPARVAPGFSTLTAQSRKSGMSNGLRNRPPLAIGFALMRRVPVGVKLFNSGSRRPLSSNSSSGR